MFWKIFGWDLGLEVSRTGSDSPCGAVLLEHISISSSSEKVGLNRAREFSFGDRASVERLLWSLLGGFE